MAQSLPVYGHHDVMPATPHFRARSSLVEPPPILLPPSPQTTYTHVPISVNNRNSSRVPSNYITSRSLSTSYTSRTDIAPFHPQKQQRFADLSGLPPLGRTAREGRATEPDFCIASSPTIMSVLTEEGPRTSVPSGRSALFHSLRDAGIPTHQSPSPSQPQNTQPESPGDSEPSALVVGSPDDLQFRLSFAEGDEDAFLESAMGDLMMY